jgi:hypothetical protein
MALTLEVPPGIGSVFWLGRLRISTAAQIVAPRADKAAIPPSINELHAAIRARLFSRFPFGWLSKAYTCPSAVFVDELDALTNQNLLDQSKRSRVPRIPANHDVGNRIPMQAGRAGQVSDRPI